MSISKEYERRFRAFMRDAVAHRDLATVADKLGIPESTVQDIVNDAPVEADVLARLLAECDPTSTCCFGFDSVLVLTEEQRCPTSTCA